MEISENKIKLKIGVDIDGVLIEHAKNYLNYHNQRFSTNFVFDDLTDFLFWKNLNLTKEEIQPLFEDFDKENKPIFLEDSRDSLVKLANFHELFVLTARPIKIKESTIKILKKEFGEIFREFNFSGEVHGNSKSKDKICLEGGIGILLEDSPEISKKCANQGIKVILFDNPWNKNLEFHENIFRVKNWTEAIEKIEEIIK